MRGIRYYLKAFDVFSDYLLGVVPEERALRRLGRLAGLEDDRQ